MIHRWILVGLILCGSVVVASAQQPPPASNSDSTEVLAEQLREFVLEFMPDPLYADESKWNLQKPNRRGQLKNDGHWIKYKITGRNLQNSLKLHIEDLRKEGNTTRFVVKIMFDAYAEMQRQNWKMGVRLYSGSTRGRFRVYLTLNCELTTRVVKTKNWLPDVFFRLRVANSQFRYDNVVVEHTAGVGGDMARLLGEMMRSLIKAAKPNLERELIAKINAAIVKAGDTKEVRVSLGEILSGKMKFKPAKSAPNK